MTQSNSPQAAASERMTLTDILRVRTRFIIDPMVDFMARFQLSPDFLTVLGMASHFLFAWLIANGRFPIAAVAIFFIAPLDALDGALARKLGRQQNGFGAFLDSTLDRVAEIILFGGFLWYFGAQGDTWMVALAYLAITGSLMVSYTRARAESLGLSAKVGLLSRVERYAVLTTFLVLNLPVVALAILALFTYVTMGQRMFHVWRQSMSTPNE
jgi:CDP-diacylglycerol--glycerol-3-phosphate 3-phosphatidyltransferase